MPLYEYDCANCGEFEAWRAMADVSLPMPCPCCEATARRIFSAPNISLNSGKALLRRQEAKDPKLVKRDRETASPRYQSQIGGRPWMIGHAPPTV